jgi:hypothetical protein
MPNLNDTVQHLYRAFILRDLMSFGLPGAIVFSSALSLLFDPSEVLASLRESSDLSGLTYLAYLAFFCISYAVGLAVQYFGVTIRMVSFHDPNIVADGGARTKRSIERSLDRNLKFQKVASDDARQYWERLAILKQMSGNLAIGVAIALIIVGVRLLIPCWSQGVAVIFVLVMILSLYLAHRDLRIRQTAWEGLWLGEEGGTGAPIDPSSGPTAAPRSS